MSQSQFKSDTLHNALEAARPAFLGAKFSIDDVSNDVRALEKELNDFGATDDFIFVLETATIPEVGRQIEDYDINAPILHRLLEWRKHGNSWRLFYRVVWLGWDLYSTLENPHVHCSIAEVDAVEALITKQTPTDETAIYNLPAGTELISKPLIDTPAEIRLSAHPYLADFVTSFAKDWTDNKYRRDHRSPG